MMTKVRRLKKSFNISIIIIFEFDRNRTAYVRKMEFSL